MHHHGKSFALYMCYINIKSYAYHGLYWDKKETEWSFEMKRFIKAYDIINIMKKDDDMRVFMIHINIMYREQKMRKSFIFCLLFFISVYIMGLDKYMYCNNTWVVNISAQRGMGYLWKYVNGCFKMPLSS